MRHDASPAARALLALERIQATPGISGARLGVALGVSDRAARRYVAILREAGIPIESVPGREGGYRVGRGYRLPPLMFSTAEALALVMAVLQGGHPDGDPTSPVESALAKIFRVLPAPVAEPAATLRQANPPRADASAGSQPSPSPSPATTAVLVQAAAAGHRLRVGYRLRPDAQRVMDVDPWAVSLRHDRWYLLCWSHTAGARRVLRVDRVVTVDVLPQTFDPPAGLDPAQVVEEHLAESWRHTVEVLVDAPVAAVEEWVPRSLARVEAVDASHTRLLGTTDDLYWYAIQLVSIQAPFRIVRPVELREAAIFLGRHLARGGGEQ